MNENENMTVPNTEQPVTPVEEPLQPADPVENAPVENIAPVEPSVPETPSEPVTPEAPAEPIVPTEPVVPEQPTSPAPTENQPTLQPVGEPITDSKKKSKLPIIIIVAVLLIAAGVAIYFFFFRKVSGEQVVQGTINKLFATAETISEKIDDAFIVDYKNDIIKSEGYIKGSIETTDETIKESLGGINSLSLKYDLQIDAKNLEGYVNLSSVENDKEVLSFTGLLKDKIGYFKSNAFDSVYKYDLTNELPWEDIKKAVEDLPEYDSKMVSKVTKKFKEYLKKAIIKDYITEDSGKFTVDGVEVDGLKTSVVITDERLNNIMISIMTSAKDDDELLELIEKTKLMTKADAKQMLEQSIESYKSRKSFDQDGKIYFNIYTTNRGGFKALEIKSNENTLLTAVSKDDVTTIKAYMGKDEYILLTYDEKKKELTWNNDKYTDIPIQKIVVTIKDDGYKIEAYVQDFKITLEIDYKNSKNQLSEKLVASVEADKDGKKTKGSLEMVCLLEKANEIKTFDITNAKDVTQLTEVELQQISNNIESIVSNSLVGKLVLAANSKAVLQNAHNIEYYY